VSCEVVEFAVLVQPGVPHAGNDLEEQDAEAEHVGLGGEEALESVLRCDVTMRAGDRGGDGLGDVGAEDPGHAEVGDLGVHVTVQEDLAGLEVPVDDPEARVLVQVEQALRDAVDDAVP